LAKFDPVHTKKSAGKIFRWRFPAAVSGEQWQFRRAVQFPTSDDGGGGWQRSMAVAVTVNGASGGGQWRKDMENRKLQQ